MVIQVETHPNPQCITLHCDKCLSEKGFSTEYKSKDEELPNWVGDILSIPGVFAFSVYHKYELAFQFGKCFDEGPIIEQVKEILERAFG